MFSEISRNLDITEVLAEQPDGFVKPFLVLGLESNYHRKRACAIPTARHMKSWAKWVLRQNWVPCEKFAHLPFTYQPAHALKVKAVRVRHLILDFNAASGVYSTKEHARYEVGRRSTERIK